MYVFIPGFEKNRVVMLGDKKLGKDSEALENTLRYRLDSCIEYTKNVSNWNLTICLFSS